MKVVISERYSPDAPPCGLEITIGVRRCFCRWPRTRQCCSASSSCHCLLVLWQEVGEPQRSMGAITKGQRQGARHCPWAVASITLLSSSFITQSTRRKDWKGTCLGWDWDLHVGHIHFADIRPLANFTACNIFIRLLTAFSFQHLECAVSSRCSHSSKNDWRAS